MLIQFSVENFLSFKDKTIFSFLAAKEDTHPTHIVTHEKPLQRRLVRATALYGANASGKSNIIKAIQFARDFILNGTQAGEAIPVSPFKLVSEPKPNSRFQFDFLYQEKEYSYGFTLNSSRVAEEFLYANEKGREAKYFERVTSEESKTDAEFGTSLTKGNRRKGSFLRYKAEDTRSNQLLLTAIFEGNIKERVEELLPVWSWFTSVLTIIEAEPTANHLIAGLHRIGPLKEYASRILSSIDTGIHAVDTRESKLDLNLLPNLPEELVNELREDMKASQDKKETGRSIEIHAGGLPLITLLPNKEGEFVTIELLLKHIGEEGQHFNFDFGEESDGTQRVLNLTPMLFSSSEGREKVYVIDEIDRRLHPHISRLIIQTMLGCKGNTQLLFTTHDTNLLDLDLLRRDEIWFVEKDKEGSSHLYSLAEFKVRPDLQIEKGYLNGRFGAIPFLGDIERLALPLEAQEPIHA